MRQPDDSDEGNPEAAAWQMPGGQVLRREAAGWLRAEGAGADMRQLPRLLQEALGYRGATVAAGGCPGRRGIRCFADTAHNSSAQRSTAQHSTAQHKSS